MPGPKTPSSPRVGEVQMLHTPGTPLGDANQASLLYKIPIDEAILTSNSASELRGSRKIILRAARAWSPDSANLEWR